MVFFFYSDRQLGLAIPRYDMLRAVIKPHSGSTYDTHRTVGCHIS